jgi:hypothetical protein
LSKTSEDELNAITESEWAEAIEKIVDCNVKETAIVKLYMTCLDRVDGVSEAKTDREYLTFVKEYMQSI